MGGANAIIRGGSQIDKGDMREINRVWERIQPYLIWHK